VKRLPFWKRPYLARRVLDIGAGHNPFHRVTHVLDIDPKEGRERGGNRLILPTSARLIVGSGTALPFRDGLFDYIYASHVLEHVDTPDLACREIMRVGAAGYIETPSPLLEQGLALRDQESPESWIHRWFVYSVEGAGLVFEPKTPGDVTCFCSCADGRFMQDFYESVDFREAQHYLRRRAKTTIFYWSSSFGIEVRKHTLDCGGDRQRCRFSGMRKMLLASCNDLLRFHRTRRLRNSFPTCADSFRKHGHRTLFIR
jgi:SAM-dependent methyltransferase